jgi:uncharacterized protein
MGKQVIQSVLWRRNDIASLEYFVLARHNDGFVLEGGINAAIDFVPLTCRYEVECNAHWHTRRVWISAERGKDCRALELTSDGQGHWWRGDEELKQVEGSVDVDISLTPSTNTLPIRRLGLRVQQSENVDALWIRLPDLTIEPLAQEYARTGERSYRYSSRGGAFTADLEVDEHGLVVNYGTFWERVAKGSDG